MGLNLDRDRSKVEAEGNFRRTVPGSGRRSYHRFVAATVSSFKKGTPRVLGWKELLFSNIYFCLFEGLANRLRTIWGHFTCFLTWPRVVSRPWISISKRWTLFSRIVDIYLIPEDDDWQLIIGDNGI